MARLGLRPAPASPRADGVYPDYVTCPHCGELEVEVWCNEKEARCHNCGKTFEHKAQPECEKES
ncbi:MAG: hypothetical protein HY023_01890 [Chloroflexi bacterium]|nr:hypothetical protein [Chloroflexota bacterium]MBI3764359.1 hypothetical protein [Chloroflexota bacterium]